MFKSRKLCSVWHIVHILFYEKQTLHSIRQFTIKCCYKVLVNDSQYPQKKNKLNIKFKKITCNT